MSSEKGWERVQIMAFTSWLNGILEKRGFKVNNIQNDMDDGLKLINFLELVSSKKMKEKYHKSPPSRIQKIENLHLALTFLNKEIQIMTGGASAEDFADHNLKMILGFFWSLFRHYRIQTIKHEDKSSEEGLLLWVKKTTESYNDVVIENYKNSFRSGNAFLALCDQFLEHNTSILDYNDVVKNNKPTEILAKAFSVAEKELGIPKLLDPVEVNEGEVDERSLVLYISLYFHAYNAKQAQKGVLEEKQKIEKEMKGLQGSLEDRAKYAAILDEENRGLKADIERLKAELLELQNSSKSEIEHLKAQLENARKEHEETKQQLQQQKELNEKANAHGIELEQQIESLKGEVVKINQNIEKEREVVQQKGNVQLKGLSVMKKNLEEHLEDLHRWQNFLDFDRNSTVDFSGEIRPQILTEMKDSTYDEQLQLLASKLDKENQELSQLLKGKIEEKKLQQAKEEEKKKKKKSDAKDE